MKLFKNFKFQTLTFFAILLFVSLSVVAQSGSTGNLNILLKPQTSNGYLAWQSTNINVDAWQIEIIERTVNSSGIIQETSVMQFSQVKAYLAVGENYNGIEGLKVKVSSLDAQGNVLETIDWDDEPLPIAPGMEQVRLCERKCNGTDYAWGITLYERINGSARTLGHNGTGAVHEPQTNTYTPYYQYMDPNQFALWRNQNPPIGWPNNGGYECIKLENIPPGTYVTAGGATINTSTVYGVPKHLEQYGGPSTSTPPLGSGNVGCWMDRNTFRNIYNVQAPPTQNGPNIRSQLVCHPSPNNEPIDPEKIQYWEDMFGWEDSVQINLFENFTYLDDSNSVFIGNVPQMTSTNAITDFIGSADGLYASYSRNGIPEQDCPVDMIFDVTLDRIDESGTFNFDLPNIFLANGSIQYPDMSQVPSGLYRMVLTFVDGTHAVFYLEFINSSNQNSAGSTDADVTDILLYPVPIVNNTYTVEISPQRNTSAVYTVRDMQGSLIYSNNNIALVESVQNEINVNLPTNITTGTTLIHFFQYEDGSVETIKSLVY